eukprot:GHVP01042308.1.p2 GENE.GHVP01042308.1~~GHVP01042308.1.p2  ORF type:complete len:115 (+),score=17.75 GHVP01042308.1:553-897(+)
MAFADPALDTLLSIEEYISQQFTMALREGMDIAIEKRQGNNCSQPFWTTIEVKNNADNLRPALVRCALYVIKDYMANRNTSEGLMNIVAISILSYKAQIGQIQFQLNKKGIIQS